MDGLDFSDRVRFHDVTLRDGEQQASVAFAIDDKVEIAKRLAQAGVDRIEAGMPAVSQEDEAAVRRIVDLELGPQIFAFARCMVSDVEMAADCGVDGVVVEIPCSEHIIQKAYGWPLEKAVDLSIEATQAAKELGLYTVYFTIDSSRSDMQWYLDVIERVMHEGHMDALALVDTFGAVSPHVVPYWVSKVRERIPDRPLECHFHEDFGMSVANSIAALGAGCEVVHTTVSGLGERAGNTPMEEVALALRMLYGVEHGLRSEEFYSLSRLVCERSGHVTPSNRPVVGDRLFEIESGIIAGWYRRCVPDDSTEVFPYHWTEVGQPAARVVFGKGSGLASFEEVFDDLDVPDDPDLRARILSQLKANGTRLKRLLPEEEVRAIVRRELREGGGAREPEERSLDHEMSAAAAASREWRHERGE